MKFEFRWESGRQFAAINQEVIMNYTVVELTEKKAVGITTRTNFSASDMGIVDRRLADILIYICLKG